MSKSKLFKTIFTILSLSVVAPAHAGDESISLNTGGIGAMAGMLQYSDQPEYSGAFVFSGSRTSLGKSYGHSHARSEIGNSPTDSFFLGLVAQGHEGYKITPAKSLILLGSEIDAQISWNGDDRRDWYIDITPALAVGLDARVGKCGAAVLARGGIALGSTGRDFMKLMAGAGAYVVCDDNFALGLEYTRFGVDPANKRSLASADITIPVSDDGYFLGFRAEAIDTDKAYPDKQGLKSTEEARGFVTFSVREKAKEEPKKKDPANSETDIVTDAR